MHIGPNGRLPFDEVVVMDTETTGLSPYGVHPDTGMPTDDPHGPDRLCSVALLLLVRKGARWRETARMSFTCNPMRPVNPQAAAVNGFGWSGDGRVLPEGMTDLALLRPLDSSLLLDLVNFIDDRPLVCHNTAFDLSVIDAELMRLDLPALSVPVLCTKKAFSDEKGLGRPHAYVKGTSLNTLCANLGVDASTRQTENGGELHGAVVDADLAACCFIHMEAMGWMLSESPADLPHRMVMNGLEGILNEEEHEDYIALAREALQWSEMSTRTGALQYNLNMSVARGEISLLLRNQVDAMLSTLPMGLPVPRQMMGKGWLILEWHTPVTSVTHANEMALVSCTMHFDEDGTSSGIQGFHVSTKVQDDVSPFVPGEDLPNEVSDALAIIADSCPSLSSKLTGFP